MSRTRSSALTFFKASTRMVTSCGFSVSSRSISRFTSANFAFCAATISRLETLSGQMRTCRLALADGGAPPAEGGGEEGSGLPPGKGWPPPGKGELLRTEDELETDRDGAEGGAGSAFRTRLRRLPSSSASEYFNG